MTREVDISVSRRGHNTDRPESLYSNEQESEAERSLWGQYASKPREDVPDYYKDSYVMDHVDPLRHKPSGKVNATVVAIGR